MAKTVQQDAILLAKTLIEDARKGIFKSVYLLMGEEPYYIDKVTEEILAHAIPEEDRDFNQYVFYGVDVKADDVITAARRYPMFSERQLVVVREAQMMKDYEELALYCERPLESTILVICLRGAKADKRRALYKTVQKVGVVLESAAIPDYKVDTWISSYFASMGLKIEPNAASLFAEFTGANLGKIVVETEKMLKNLPEGTQEITVKDIEENIGISRQMSIFELSNALSENQTSRAMKIAGNLSSVKGFSMVPCVSLLYAHFYKLLRNALICATQPSLPYSERAARVGVPPFALKKLDDAQRYWPQKRCMSAIALLKDYDYKSKGGDGGEMNESEIFRELVIKLLTL